VLWYGEADRGREENAWHKRRRDHPQTGTCKINTTICMQPSPRLEESWLVNGNKHTKSRQICLSMDWMGFKPKPPTKSPRHLDML